MKILSFAVCVVVLISPPGAAVAQNAAKDLADGCRVYASVVESPDSPPPSLTAKNMAAKALDAGACVGYIDGFIAGYSTGRGAPAEVRFCLPEGVSTGQIARLIAKRIEDNPQFENVSRLEATLGILMGTWPCPQ